MRIFTRVGPIQAYTVKQGFKVTVPKSKPPKRPKGKRKPPKR